LLWSTITLSWPLAATLAGPHDSFAFRAAYGSQPEFAVHGVVVFPTALAPEGHGRAIPSMRAGSNANVPASVAW
jgi:hypothetical protein